MSAGSAYRCTSQIHDAYYANRAAVRRAAADRHHAFNLPLNLLYRRAIRSRSAVFA